MCRSSNFANQARSGHFSQKNFHVMLDLLPLTLKLLLDKLNDLVLAAGARNGLPD
jgi:hypothetical protein